MPSTKPSSSTYISTPKPMTPNQTTGSRSQCHQAAPSIGSSRHRQRPRRRSCPALPVLGRLPLGRGPRASSLQQVPDAGAEDEQRTRRRTRSAKPAPLPASMFGLTGIGGAQHAVDRLRLAADLGDVPAGEQGDEAGRASSSASRAAASASRTACRAATPTATRTPAAASACRGPTITRNA